MPWVIDFYWETGSEDRKRSTSWQPNLVTKESLFGSVNGNKVTTKFYQNN